MLVIAGGVLLAVAVLVMLVATLRYIVLALSVAFCLAVGAGAWLLLRSGIGPSWATVLLVGGLVIWFWSANRDSLVGKLPGANSAERSQRLKRKIS
jgi:hypothetical protein